jgi:hypothetical protein
MTETRTAVIAVGGNALSPPGETSTIGDQFRHTRESLGPIVDLALSARYTPGAVSLSVGAEAPLDSAVGAPNVRAVVGLGWAPRVHDQEDRSAALHPV